MSRASLSGCGDGGDGRRRGTRLNNRKLTDGLRSLGAVAAPSASASPMPSRRRDRRRGAERLV
jgi:hypothetical protein